MSLFLLIFIQSQWIFFLPAQWWRITVTVVGCYFCLFSLFPPHGLVRPLVGVTDFIGSTFLKRLSYQYISLFPIWPLLARLCVVILSRNLIPAQWRRITVAMVYCCFLVVFFVSYSLMSATTRWRHWSHWKYVAERLYHHYISLFHT